jgi:hypothetical protein
MTDDNYNKEYYSRPDIKEAHAKYMKEYYQKNKLKLLAKQSEYYVENKDKIKDYMKVYMRTYKKKSDLGVDNINPVS